MAIEWPLEAALATVNPLTEKATNHSYHSGHSKQETFAGDEHERCDADPSPAENSGPGLARKVFSIDGYNGKSGNSTQNQGLTGGHRKNANGHSGKSPLDQQLASVSTRQDDLTGPDPSALADASRSDSTIWGDLYEERAAHRQFDGGYRRHDAELLAWREIEWRWHLAHRERVAAEVCAGCGQFIRPAEALEMIDGARIHMKGSRCRLAYDQRWRAVATNALIALGLRPPATDEEAP